MDSQKSSLVVAIQSAEFAKEFHYFLTVNFDGDQEKRRTDVSAQVTNPVFTSNVFVLPLPHFKIDIQSRLQFQAFIVTDREENQGGDLEKKGQARLLGECVLELGPLTHLLTDISGTGSRQLLKFTRTQNGKQVTVGRFMVQLKLVGEDQLPANEDRHFIQLHDNSIFHQLPQSLQKHEFSWRIKVDIRSGVDMPLNRSTHSSLPTCFVELGWTLYDNQPPEDLDLQLTNLVDNNRHPIWNQQFYIYNPPGVINKEGFFHLCFRDRNLVDPLDRVYIPLAPMKPFVPYNFEFFSSVQEFEARGSVYVSFVLEMVDRESFVDSLVDIVVYRATYDPLPLKSNRMFLVMTTNSYTVHELSFLRVDLKGPKNIAKIIEENSDESNRVFISSIMNIPPLQVESYYNAVAVYTVSKKLLEAGLQFFIIGRDDSKGSLHGMPNFSVGYTDVVDNLLQRLLFDENKVEDKAMSLVPVTWDKESSLFHAFNTTKCRLELACYPFPEVIPGQKPNEISNDEPNDLGLDEREPEPLITGEERDQNLGIVARQLKNINDLIASKATDKEKWDILSKELAQKQELIHRLIRESDDKTESLKITGSEIVDLRRQIKMLQSENAILRKRLAQEEQIEVASIVTKEIAKMGIEELRAKIVKLAQAYRDERVRNEQFERSLKGAQKEIAQSRQLQTELEVLRKKHTDGSRRLIDMQQEISKIQVYKDTIKKQEKVIAKLEKLMESTLKDTQKARGAMLELEQLKTENMNLQKHMKEMAFGPEGYNSELEKYKQECSRLERLVAELREDLSSKRPTSGTGNPDWDREKIELEIKLQKSNARVQALQEEITDVARNFAKERSKLEIAIAEKQAQLDAISLHF